MKIAFTPNGWDDYISWAGDRKTLARINRLITKASRDPGTGTGKPERLSGNLAGYWSAGSTRSTASSTPSRTTRL